MAPTDQPDANRSAAGSRGSGDRVPNAVPGGRAEPFASTIVGVHGDLGRAWLDDLGATIERWQTRWSLGPLTPFALSYSWVAATTRADGSACVLKLVPPGTGILDDEARWLAAVDGRGAVRLLEDAAADGALLLERVVPGETAATLVPHADDEATAAIAGVLRQIQRPVPDGVGLPTLAERTTDLAAHRRRHEDAGSDPLPVGLVAAAEQVAGELLRTADGEVLLHGDLHHDNVLRDRTRGWLAIDPHGLRGDPVYEAATMIYNPLELGPGALDRLDRRTALLARELGFDEQRIRAWGFVQAVLSVVWDLEDGGPISQAEPAPLAVARRLMPR